MTQPILDHPTTTVIGSYPQPDWLVDRALLSKGVPARAAAGDLAGARALARAGPGRRHHRGHPRHGARRHRHHQRRRDPARELLEPLRHRARRRGRRPARGDHRPLRQPDPRAARGRAGAAGAAGGAARHAVPPPQHRPPGQDHPARPVHHGPAGQERVLPRPGGAGDGPGRRGQRGGPRPPGRGRRSHPARRAVAAQRSRGRQALRGARDQPRARGPHRADRAPPLLRLRGGGAPPEADRLLVPAAARGAPSPSRSRSRPRSPSSTWACSPTSRARPSSSA